MKKVVSTIVTMGLISSMLVTTVYAGDRHGGGFNPLWAPVAILSTLAAAVTIAQPPVVYERHVDYVPRQTVVYEEPPRQTVVYVEPRHYRHEHNYERGPENRYHYERECRYEAPRYREYR